MREEMRDISGFLHSPEAIEALDHVFLTAKQAAAFYEELRHNGSVILYGMAGRFFLRDNEVCHSSDGNIDSRDNLTEGQIGQIHTIGHTDTTTAQLHSDESVQTFQCSNLGCKLEIQVEKEHGRSRRRPLKTKCPGCGGKLILPLGTVLLQA